MGRPTDLRGLSQLVWLAAVCISVTGCNRRLLSVFFDVPPEAPANTLELAPTPATDQIPPWLLAVDTIRPEIESSLDPDSAVALLPRDHAGNIDWMEALRSGVIDPRDAVSDSVAALPPEYGFRFGFDFYLPGPNEQLDAYFPHSAHTEWVDCSQCHSRIFRYRDTEITMADVFQGKYCGECHGKVAFPVISGCERCHTGLPMPPDRAAPDLIGTIQMARVERDSTAVEDTLPVSDNFVTESLPPAQFPHWVHRIRYTCKSCHMDLFEPRAGSNRILMADIEAGASCGACHNGRTAFEAGFNECHRCHVAADPPPDTSDEPVPGSASPDTSASLVFSSATHGSRPTHPLGLPVHGSTGQRR